MRAAANATDDKKAAKAGTVETHVVAQASFKVKAQVMEAIDLLQFDLLSYVLN